MTLAERATRDGLPAADAQLASALAADFFREGIAQADGPVEHQVIGR
jgi:hypothetical protein